MKDIPVRHYLNPSFQPVNDFYIGLPVIGFSQFGVGNNSLVLKDVIYKMHGENISFLNPHGNVELFYNTLKSNTVIGACIQTNLISVGFRREKTYWTFSLSDKIDGMVCLPKDLFKFALFGTPDVESNLYDFAGLQADISVYAEAALGCSKMIYDKWSLGGKLKLLLGSANFSNVNNQMDLYAGIDKWSIKGGGSLNFASPLPLRIGDNFSSFSYLAPVSVIDWLKPVGVGAGVDFGTEYHLNKHVRFSGSITDLGFIHWARNVYNYQYGIDFTFKGIKLSSTSITTYKDIFNGVIPTVLVDSLTNALESSTSSNLSDKRYTTGTIAKLNLGIEYSLSDDRISFGVLSRSQFFKTARTGEITASVNGRPNAWLNATLSYSVFNGRMSCFGAGLGVKTGFVHWFFAADYFPFQKATFALSDLGLSRLNRKVSVPYNSTSFNLSAGVNLVFSGVKAKGLHSKKPKQDCHCNWK